MVIVSSDSIASCTCGVSLEGAEPESCEGCRRSRVVAWDGRKTAEPAPRAVPSSQAHPTAAPALLSIDRLSPSGALSASAAG